MQVITILFPGTALNEDMQILYETCNSSSNSLPRLILYAAVVVQWLLQANC